MRARNPNLNRSFQVARGLVEPRASSGRMNAKDQANHKGTGHTFLFDEGFTVTDLPDGIVLINGGFLIGGLTIFDEGDELDTAATSLDFVGDGVVASGDTAAKTITVAGVNAEGVAATGAVGEILITDTPAGSPLIFADLIQNEAGTDLVYADLV